MPHHCQRRTPRNKKRRRLPGGAFRLFFVAISRGKR
jgi:hypothetical protein